MFVCYYALCRTCLHVFSLKQWSSLHYHVFWDNQLPCKYIDENHPLAMGNWQWGYSNKKVSALNSNAYMYVSICKQEAHGPHRSPEKALKSINTFVESYELIWRGEINHLLFVIKWSVFVIHRVPFIKRCFVPIWLK